MMAALHIRHILIELILLTVFLAHQIGQKIFNLSIPSLDASLDPVLCFPLLLPIVEWEYRRRKDLALIPTIELIAVSILLMMFFEWVCPLINSDLVADPMDFLWYTLGLLFYLLRRKVIFSMDYKPKLNGV